LSRVEATTKLLASRIDSWTARVTRNVPGRQTRTPIAHAGGAPKDRSTCDQVAANGYEGFVLS